MIQYTSDARGPQVLDEAAKFAALRQAAGIDFETKLKGLVLVVDGDRPQNATWAVSPLAEHREGLWAGHGPAKLSRHSEHQLCQLAHMPREFVRKLPPGMQFEIANYALQTFSDRENTALRLSTLDVNGAAADWRCRAIVSTKYCPMDDAVVFGVVQGALTKFPDARLIKTEIEDTHTRLTLGFEPVIVAGQEFLLGVSIMNSEVGCAALRLDAYLNKLVCSNGMTRPVGENGFVFRHFGDRSEDQIQNLVRGAMYDSLEAAKQLASEYDEAAKIQLVKPEEELRRFAVTNSFSQEQLDRLMKCWEENTTPTLAGVIDATTAYARDETALAQRQQLEMQAASWMTKQIARHREAVA